MEEPEFSDGGVSVGVIPISDSVSLRFCSMALSVVMNLCFFRFERRDWGKLEELGLIWEENLGRIVVLVGEDDERGN